MTRLITQTDVLERIRSELSTLLDRPIPSLEPSTTLVQLGLDSGRATLLVIALEEWLDLELDPDVLLQMETFGEISGYVARAAGAGGA